MTFDVKHAAKQFWEDGYIVIPGFFSSADLRRIEPELEAYVRDVAPQLKVGEIHYENPPSKAIKSMFRMQDHADFFRQLAYDDRLIGLMRAIFPEGEVICRDVGFFGKAAREGSITPPHQDNAFNFWTPPYGLKASLALDPATPENGAMWVQKHSHKLGLLPHRPSGVLGFSQSLVEPVDTQEYPEAQLCMQPGDLALHHTDCIHRSEANHTDQARRMLSFIYRSSVAVRDESRFAEYQNQLREQTMGVSGIH